MNKEEIEEAKECLYGIIRNTYSEEKAIKLNNLRKYIEYLETKLDKVTDKLKKDANKKIPLAEDMDWVRCRKEHAREILNIIEGGIKND